MTMTCVYVCFESDEDGYRQMIFHQYEAALLSAVESIVTNWDSVKSRETRIRLVQLLKDDKIEEAIQEFNQEMDCYEIELRIGVSSEMIHNKSDVDTYSFDDLSLENASDDEDLDVDDEDRDRRRGTYGPEYDGEKF